MSLFGMQDDDRARYVDENTELIDRLGAEIVVLQELTKKHATAIDLQITEIRSRLALLSPERPTDI